MMNGGWGLGDEFWNCGIVERARKTRFSIPQLGAFWQASRSEVDCLKGSAATRSSKIRGISAFGADAPTRSKIHVRTQGATQ